MVLSGLHPEPSGRRLLRSVPTGESERRAWACTFLAGTHAIDGTLAGLAWEDNMKGGPALQARQRSPGHSCIDLIACKDNNCVISFIGLRPAFEGNDLSL